jgi:type IV pilus assembly protein PilC
MMAVYEYTAKDGLGNELSGTYTNIDSVQTLRAELMKVGCVLVRARRDSPGQRLARKVPQRDVAAFAYKFASMYSAGLPLVRCLDALVEQVNNRALKSVLADVRQRVETGSSLKSAFEPHRGVFSDFFLGMIDAGESAGKLSTALEMSAQYLEKRLSLHQKTRAAFVYPIVVGVVCCLVVLCLLIFVVPMFSQLYQRMHVNLPGPTQALVTLSLLLRGWWWALLLAAVGIPLAVRRLSAAARVRHFWDWLRLRIPLVGPLNRLIVVSRFIRTFGILISVGIPVMDALDVAGSVAHHSEVSAVTGELQKATRAGQPFSQSLAAHRIFPPMVVQLVVSGEEAGILPEMLEKGADLLDRDIDRMTTALLVKLEPALTIIMGLVIGLILMGVYLPMFDYMAKMTS